MQQIGPRVGMRLIHMTHTEHRGSDTYHHYRIQTAWVDRPPEGVRTGSLRCATCGDMVGFRLRSRARAEARRGLWLAIGLIAAAALAVLIVITARMISSGSGGESRTLVPAALAVVALIPSVILLPGEDGVSLIRLRGSGPHAFKPMKIRAAWSKPAATDRPAPAEIVFHDPDPPAPPAP
ncbi:hypothetical protein YW5DRAFT_05787 [Streptomyces sp. Ncost-T6T-1]|uniref:hypothetical protein n=1 Tax=Streptomyces sp. Ncost-T6T-1 TaxID=1100828 RepID=UPI0008060346|nr:hypothetical protein [Streptomyces sp. Ncost-T6T-1]SBU98188.1 hypothetical protein YW5DRAFT_05787 [Streptomyces sp. Ncost-T6T-1]